jgi:HAMP domain-containing protein
MQATTGDKLIYVAAKAVHGPDGKLLGGVAVCPLWNIFTQETIDPVRFGKRGYGYILDASGRVIAHAVDKKLLLQDVSKEDFVQKALASGEGSFRYEWKGEGKFMAVSRIPSTGWLVCMSSFDAEVTAPARTQRLVLLGIGLVVLLCVGTLITWQSRRLVFHPLRSLSDFTAHIAAGDYKAAMTGRFQAELATFAGNLRHMVEELKKRLGFSQGVLDGIPPRAPLSARIATCSGSMRPCVGCSKNPAPATPSWASGPACFSVVMPAARPCPTGPSRNDVPDRKNRLPHPLGQRPAGGRAYHAVLRSRRRPARLHHLLA